jgi:lipoprotein NlpD
MRTALRLLSLLACLALAGCFSRPRAVVVDRSTEPAVSRSVPSAPIRRGREYLVVRGDTLYGIAFRHGVDFRELARWNAIPSPYTIYPGQRLRLDDGSARRSAATPPRAPRTRTPATPPVPDRSLTQMPVHAPPGGTRPPAVAPPPVTTNPSAPRSAAPAVPVAATPTPLPSPPPALASATPSGKVAWRWPASGQLVSRYTAGDPTRQGINIAGNSGQPVYAAAAGEVVYSGAGLIGYGELVIIKHSDEFLSAYGHNRKRLVAEGQRVTAGQQIAEMGRSGAARDMLHFEIRRSGKPIDPMPLLPKR